MARTSLTPYVVQHVPSGRRVEAPAKTAAGALSLGLKRLRRQPAAGRRQPAPTARDCVVLLHGWQVPC